ncbi:MAG: HDOD domain-containing protein [Acidobacteria bacterium]|nr:HDOD domain-containing protein [Acidobacteriota bacterium]
MLVRCPICRHQNGIEDGDVPEHQFSLKCDGCDQLLSVKVVIEAMNLLRAKQEKTEAGPKNRVTDYLREHMNELQLPVLPILASKVRAVKNDPKGSLNEVVNLVKTDQIIASKILSLANSARFGGLVEISDLKMAITRLGLTVTEILVTALENKRIYSSDNHDLKPFLEEFWKHALGVALTSQILAQTAKVPGEEEIFTAGLLHDFGYILFLQGMTKMKTPKVDMKALTMKAFLEVARPDHAEIGCIYLEKSGLPARLLTIIKHHEEVPPEESENRPLHVVCLANLLCRKVGLAPEPDPEIRLEITESAHVLGLNEIQLAELEVQCEDYVHDVAGQLAG